MKQAYGALCYDSSYPDAEGLIRLRVWLQVSEELGDYYRWRAQERFQRPFYPSAFGPHVSLVCNEPVPECSLDHLENRAGELVRFHYWPRVQTNSRHVWLPVVTSEGRDLRRQLGLPGFPPYNFHLTVGRFIPRNRYPQVRQLRHALLEGVPPELLPDPPFGVPDDRVEPPDPYAHLYEPFVRESKLSDNGEGPFD